MISFLNFSYTNMFLFFTVTIVILVSWILLSDLWIHETGISQIHCCYRSYPVSWVLLSTMDSAPERATSRVFCSTISVMFRYDKSQRKTFPGIAFVWSKKKRFSSWHHNETRVVFRCDILLRNITEMVLGSAIVLSGVPGRRLGSGPPRERRPARVRYQRSRPRDEVRGAGARGRAQRVERLRRATVPDSKGSSKDMYVFITQERGNC